MKLFLPILFVVFTFLGCSDDNNPDVAPSAKYSLGWDLYPVLSPDGNLLSHRRLSKVRFGLNADGDVVSMYDSTRLVGPWKIQSIEYDQRKLKSVTIIQASIVRRKINVIYDGGKVAKYTDSNFVDSQFVTITADTLFYEANGKIRRIERYYRNAMFSTGFISAWDFKWSNDDLVFQTAYQGAQSQPLVKKSEIAYTYYEESNHYPLRQMEDGQQHVFRYLIWDTGFERISGKRLKSYRETGVDSGVYELEVTYEQNYLGSVTEKHSKGRSKYGSGAFSDYSYLTEIYNYGK